MLALGTMLDLFTADFTSTAAVCISEARPIAFAPEGLHVGRSFITNISG
jgi:hypothetical protein